MPMGRFEDPPRTDSHRESHAGSLSLEAEGSLRGALLRALRDGLRRPALPRIAKESYRRERFGELTLPLATVLMEGGVVGVIADKIYAVSPFVLAGIAAIPMAANLTSFLWARVAHGRRKVPLLVALQAAMVLGIGGIAFLPEGPIGAWQLIATMAVSRILLGGMIAVRSLVWTLNYADSVRARVTSRLQLITSAVVTVSTLAIGAILDHDPALFPFVYAGGAAIAALGVIAIARIRLIGEEEHLAIERGSDPERSEAAAPWVAIREMFRADPYYARYQLWQFGLGVSNMMTVPTSIYVVSRELETGYFTSLTLIMAIPAALGALTLPLWARYLDRVHIVRFRSRFSWLFCLSQALTFLGALLGSIGLIAVARIALGAAHGGGSLAWQLGHNDFATRDRVGLYMGLHVSLTGLRGCIAPFVGMALFAGWDGAEILGLRVPAFAGIGALEFGVAALLGLAAWIGFCQLERDMTDAGLVTRDGRSARKLTAG